MMRSVKASTEIVVLALMVIVIAWPALAQTLSIDQAHAGAYVVGGTAEPGSGPITVYTDIPQITSKLTEIVPKLHRRWNGFSSATV